jgi:2-oxo-hept-3-ene-1,7-dioate hydratase
MSGNFQDSVSLSPVERALARGMEAQLARWREQVAASGRRLGWKIGFNDRASQERLSLREPVIGFMHRDGMLESGATFVASPGSTIKAEMEIAIRIGRDVHSGSTTDEAEAAIAALAPAFEIVDVTHPLEGIEALLRGNLYHAAVVIGAEVASVPRDPRSTIHGRLRVEGGVERVTETARLPERFGDLVRVAADTLGRHGERLCAGDWIISGSIVEPLAIEPGSRIQGEIAPFEPISLSFSVR